MTTPANRFKGWIDSLALEWRDRLRGWMASWLVGGIIDSIDTIEPEALDTMTTIMVQIRDDPNTPADIKDVINKAITPGAPLPMLLLIPLAVLMLVPTVTSISQPLGNILRYKQERLFKSFRLDPLSVITAWRRDPAQFEQFFNDLRDEGWSEERIEALKFFTLFYPAPADLIRWQAREVFEPAMITKYGLDDELGGIEREPFYKAGMTDEQITNYWRAHWEHASWMQIVEMLHRKLITEKDVYDWFRLVEIPPYWRELLIKTAYTWPTRVDVRRWWDMRTIDEPRLRELYEGMGYRGKNLDDYVLWTKVYVAFPTLIARWTNGWITEQDVRDELTKLGMPYDRINEMIQEKKKSVEAGQVDEGKALTKSEIYKGVKEGRITRDQAIDLLMDLNYNLAQAEYLIDINVGALEGSPETYEEFKDITTKYKIAIGKEAKPMPEEIKPAADEVVRLTKEIEVLHRAIKDEKAKLIPDEILPPETTARLDELRVTLHRAEAELFHAQSEYDRLVAEWKHKEG